VIENQLPAPGSGFSGRLFGIGLSANRSVWLHRCVDGSRLQPRCQLKPCDSEAQFDLSHYTRQESNTGQETLEKLQKPRIEGRRARAGAPFLGDLSPDAQNLIRFVQRFPDQVPAILAALPAHLRLLISAMANGREDW
jgi:hypothetical protein